MRKSKEKTQREPKLIEALIPIIVLIGLLYVVIHVFNEGAMGGAAQIALLISAAVVVIIGTLFCKIPFQKLEESIIDNIKGMGNALVMLLIIGAIGSTWMLSGVVPTMIVYGMKILSPKIFLFSTVIICAIVSLMTGSSWTTVATFGVALLGIGQTYGISAPLCAGAIISGAYFGDKMSPLSDTCIMSSQMAGVPLFKHIKYMLYTTVPSITLTLIIFMIIGFTIDTNSAEQSLDLSLQIRSIFNISPWLLLVPVATIIFIVMKLPTLAVLFLSVAVALVPIIVCQPQIIQMMAGVEHLNHEIVIEKIVDFMGHGAEFHTGNATIDELATTSGMGGMLNTIWLILCAACFGGSMIGSGMLGAITAAIVKHLHSAFSVVATTSLSGIFCNVCTSDQYLSIIINTSLYKEFYEKEGYEPRLLSRTVEDSTTVTSVLVPWNTCGMTQSTVLGVATMAYLPYCFFNIISPLMTMFMAAIGYKIKKVKR